MCNINLLCAAGYTGAVCEVEIDECLSSPCRNGATCVNNVGGYECMCNSQIVDLSEFTGDPNRVYE